MRQDKLKLSFFRKFILLDILMMRLERQKGTYEFYATRMQRIMEQLSEMTGHKRKYDFAYYWVIKSEFRDWCANHANPYYHQFKDL